jgi:hypothetical protein
MKTVIVIVIYALLTIAVAEKAITVHRDFIQRIDYLWIDCDTDSDCKAKHGHEMFW